MKKMPGTPGSPGCRGAFIGVTVIAERVLAESDAGGQKFTCNDHASGRLRKGKVLSEGMVGMKIDLKMGRKQRAIRDGSIDERPHWDGDRKGENSARRERREAVAGIPLEQNYGAPWMQGRFRAKQNLYPTAETCRNA